jgi:ATP-dependent DNA ligase
MSSAAERSPSAAALRSRRSRRRRKQGLANFEGIVSKRLGSRYRSGRSKDWLKFKNPDAPAVKREVEEEWG